VNASLALVPVLLMLALLQLMDSFKLVRLPAVLLAITAGAGAAVVLLPVHAWLLDASGLTLTAFTRYLSPATEETLKAVFVVFLLWRRFRPRKPTPPPAG